MTKTEELRIRINAMRNNEFCSSERTNEAEASLSSPHKDYKVFTEQQCCYYVNTHRHDVNTVSVIKDGTVVCSYCSWCGGAVPTPAEDDIITGSFDSVGVHALNSRLFWAGYGEPMLL